MSLIKKKLCRQQNSIPGVCQSLYFCKPVLQYLFGFSVVLFFSTAEKLKCIFYTNN